MRATRPPSVPAWDPLDMQAERQPDTIAVDADGGRWSWSHLGDVADVAAARLAEAGVRGGDRVAVVAQEDARFVALVHAVRRLGDVLVPLSRRATVAELAMQLESVGSTALVVDEATAPALSDLPLVGASAPGIVSLEDLTGGPIERRPTDIVERTIDPDRPSTIVFTSGSSGRPRAAVLTHANHLASAAAWAAFLRPRPTDRWLGCLPFNHVGGL